MAPMAPLWIRPSEILAIAVMANKQATQVQKSNGNTDVPANAEGRPQRLFIFDGSQYQKFTSKNDFLTACNSSHHLC